MNTRTLVGTVAVIALMVGCASPKLFWTKPGGNQDAFARDRYDCAREASAPYSSAYVGPYGGSSQQGVRVDHGLFNACMEARGWRLVRQDR